LQTWPTFQTARCILAYCSFRNEPDLSPLMDHRRYWGLPRCVGKQMVWHQWLGPQSLQTGKYGITEPVAIAPEIHPDRVDLILVPAVACDVTGYRPRLWRRLLRSHVDQTPMATEANGGHCL
jgi:5-formyltetrahydrofolate cyclo-ligase